LGLLASLENVLSFALFIYLVRHARQIIKLARAEFFIRYALIFTATMMFLLALVYYNVGLGLRQRVMFYPTLFTLFVTHNLLSRAREKLRLKALVEAHQQDFSPVGPLVS
jgi:hypothetical protein